jgi:hypothetical protein
MPIEYSVNIAYDDIYNDYETVDIDALLAEIPTSMALALVCHYNAQIHTQEKNPNFQLKAISDWCRRFPLATRQKIQSVIDRFNSKQASNFNFINNISSLLLIERLLEKHNDLPSVQDLTPIQEENLFKAYLYFSAKWTKAQEAGAIKYRDKSVTDMALVMMLPYSELLEFKDFRLQFIKAVYFFKFCEDNEIFKEYLAVFLKERAVTTWNEYLFNLVSVYIFLLGEDSVKSVLQFDEKSKNVFSSLEKFCVDVTTFQAKEDFLTLRAAPVYRYSDNELLFLNINFLIDKIYQGIIFDFADVLIAKGVQYKGKLIKNRQQFFGIFGDEFIEPGLFYEVIKNVFRQKDYVHCTGDELKAKFGEGAPDYLIIDNAKVYAFEYKNTFFSGPVKYTFDIDNIKQELDKKFVANEAGKPKGVTQLVNFIEDFSQGRYDQILKQKREAHIIYPILVTQDFTFNLPVVYSLILSRYNEILKASNKIDNRLQIKSISLIDLDLLVKFQDLFISKRLTLNHVLADYQKFLGHGKNSVDRSLSFHKYLHVKTSRIDYGSPKMFMEEIKNRLFPDEKEEHQPTVAKPAHKA